MGRRLKPAGVKRTVVFDPELDALMQSALGRRSMSDFVNEAVAQRLARWEPPAVFVAKKRGSLGHSSAGVSVFDPAKVDELGWPLALPADTSSKAQLQWKLQSAGVEGVQALMRMMWSLANLGEYTEAHLAETLRRMEAA